MRHLASLIPWFAAMALSIGFAAAPVLATPAVTSDVKVYAFIVKKHDISDEQFHSHWRHPHGDLTKQIPQINRYLQNHGVANPAALGGLPTMPYLGIATIWVADVSKLDDIFKDPGFKDVHEDELNLLERSQLAWLVSQETVVTDGPRRNDESYQATKGLIFFKRAAGSSVAEFHAALESAALFAAKAVRNARVTFAVPHPMAKEEKPVFDGVIEIATRDDLSFARSWERHGAEITERLGSVIDTAGTRGFLAHERRVIWPRFH